MTTVADQPRPRRSWLLLPLGVSSVVALASGIVIGATWSSDHADQWHTGQGYVGADQASVRYDGWTYGGVVDAVPWIDAEGTWHEGGWPTCLHHFQTQAVRFQARSVTIKDTTWRPIVAISCAP